MGFRPRGSLMCWPQKASRSPGTGLVSLPVAVAVIRHSWFQPHPFPFHMFILPDWPPEGIRLLGSDLPELLTGWSLCLVAQWGIHCPQPTKGRVSLCVSWRCESLARPGCRWAKGPRPAVLGAEFPLQELGRQAVLWPWLWGKAPGLQRRIQAGLRGSLAPLGCVVGDLPPPCLFFSINKSKEIAFICSTCVNRVPNYMLPPQ